MTEPNEMPRLFRGMPEHDARASESEAVLEASVHLHIGLELVGSMIEAMTENINKTDAATNVVGALACFTRALRGIRAAALLAMAGLYIESRGYIRDIYESASLARMLAKRPDKADAWLLAERWINDNEVRNYIQNLTMPDPGVAESPYRRFYRVVGDVHHPTARATIPLVIDEQTELLRPKLETSFDEKKLCGAIREVAMMSGFVCLTMLNAAVHPDIVHPGWRQAVVNYLRAIDAEADWANIDQDWSKVSERYTKLQQSIQTGEELRQSIINDPRSYRNVVDRLQTDGES
jgi:hypothetical protein